MLNQFRPALVLLVLMTALTGLAYPLAMTGLAGVIAPAAATGSLIYRDEQMIGSALVAQDFTEAGYLHPRPSASGFATVPSGGSNLGPTSAGLIAAVEGRRADWQAANGGEAPIDAVTGSGSGLDPHVSPANAEGQAGRIAQARGVEPAQVRAILASQTEGRWLGLFGAPRVNVLRANLALDEALPLPPAGGN